MHDSENWVISGMSGRFPESENLDVFWEHLIQGKDMISDNPRWDSSQVYETPRRAGKIPLIDKFDASYFGVSGTQANTMDPKIRISLEVVYEAIMDSGIDPKTLSGARVGVFMASTGMEAFEVWLRSTEYRTGHYITGCHVCMLADRISYAFNFKGPSCVFDSGCSASFSALQYALLALKNGLCDSAIVAGANINNIPFLSSAFFNFKALSADGKCKVFDASADGFVRSEAVVAIYICRKDCAKRLYSTILGVKCLNDGYKQEGISVPSWECQAKIMKEVYAEAGVNPLDVNYIEAHGTGTKVGDPNEIAALADTFCSGRVEPLLVGSVKSNMGHAEPASGLCGIVKVLLSRRSRVIPPNLHFQTPNPECKALVDGRIKVVVEATPFQGCLVGINSFGIGGTTGHAILKFEDIDAVPANMCQIKTDEVLGFRSVMRSQSDAIPTLILASGRTKESLKYLLNQTSKVSKNRDFVGLLQEIAGAKTPKHKFLGFTLNGNTDFKLTTATRPESPRTLCYVYTGLGSQWLGISKALLKFRAFNASIQLSEKCLKNFGLDLESVFQTEDTRFVNTLQNAFVAITACQIALTDILMSINIYSDMMVGQSLGEVTCGYNDGCLTREQALLASLYRAKAFTESNLPPGTLATTAMTWKEAQERCPSDIFPAIHSAENNVTISGPYGSIRELVEILTNEGTFAKEVKSAVYAYHSPYVRTSEKLMLNMMKDIIPEQKRRSAKWLSSSVPVNDWESELAKYCSAEYLVNNAMSPVYLHELFQSVPEHAVVVEIGPHCFLQTILKQSMAATVTVLGLMHCNHENTMFFLQSVGKLFVAGFRVKCTDLYKPLRFPVPIETPSISPLMLWDHTLSWEVPMFKNELAGSHGIKFLINSSIDEFYAGHVIQGRILFPATGYICLAWKALAKLHGTNIDYFPIHLENIHFKRMTILQENKGVEFIVNVLNESGQFEIIESTEIVCTGTIRKAHRMDEELFSTNVNDSTLENYLESEDFYHLLFLRGYNYQGLFRGIQKIAMGGTRANINWNDNWICLLDTMIQTYILSMCSSLNELGVPVQLNSVTIFPTMFRDNLDRNTTIVNVCKFTDVVECHGIQLCGLNASMISRVTTLVNPTVATQKFVPFFETHEVVSETAVFEFFVGIAVENVDIFSESFIFTDVRDIILSVSINLQPLVYHKFKFYEHRIVINEHTTQSEDILPNSQMFVTIKELKYLSPSNLVWTNKESEIPACMELLNDNGFLIITSASQITCDLCLIAQHCTDSHYVYLFRKQYGFLQKPEVVSLDVPEFGWVEILKERLMSNNHLNRVYILSRSEISGIIGFANCLLKEPGMQNIRCLYIKNSPNVCTEQILNDELLKKDLVIQVCCNGSWGTYTNININEPEVPKNSDHAYASIKTIGDLSTLCWVESSCKLHQKSNYEVYFASLNFKDILLATGKLSKSAFADQLDGYLGLEFSGTYRNRRVCGISSGNCLASVLDCKPRMIWDVPEHWSLSEAATVPTVYATVLYALVMRGRVTKGETILIHSGSGGVGLAAITIALELNCVVFTTVGSNKKREFLKTKFSELPEERILNNQNGEKFKREILRQTNGIGVDVVLNSLALDQLKASLHCLSKGGRFLEIGKVDSVNNSAIGLAVLLKDIDIQGVHLDKVISSQSKRMLHLQSLLQEYLNKGKLKPLPFKCFGQEHLEDAFRYFASRQHVGKVIIKVRESCGTTNIAALPRSYFSPQKTYIIIGGLGGMGLEIVTWMITRGARRIFVVSRSGVSTTYQKYMMKSWETFGATIFMRHTDISNRKEVSKLIMEAISICPLGGVFNLALVLQDALFSNQTAKAFEMVSNSKATATLHFDALTRLYAPSMDYFVVFSSLACGKGNAGQSNYGYANSAMERICEQRIQDGFPARAIQWGVVADVGSVHKQYSGKQVILGTIGQPISSCIETLDLLLQQTETVVSSCLLSQGNAKPYADSKHMSLSQTVANILGIPDLENIDLSATLTEHGMDSIMAAQIKLVIQEKSNIVIPVSNYSALTFKDLQCVG